jgi:flagellin
MSSFSINTNMASLQAQQNLNTTSMNLSTTLQQLSSGLKINSSADDAAGLAVANRDTADNADLQVGISSAGDAISGLQVTDGAMTNISSLLDRALTLASQAASDTFQGSRTTLDNEFQTVMQEITRTAGAAGVQTGSADLNSQSVFVGNTQTNTASAVTYVSFALTTAVYAQGLGISSQTITSSSAANTAIAAIQSAIGTLGTVQGTVGATMNRLQYAVSEAQTESVGVQQEVSNIMDANIAQSASNMTKYNTLNQTGLAALSQANQSASSVLSLLR